MPEPIAPVDTSVRVPAAVRAAAARADALVAAQRPNPETQDPAATAQPGTVTPAGNQTSEPVAEPQSAPPPSPQPSPDTLDPNDESWEKRYKAMKGRFEKSERLVQQLSDQIRDLQNMLAVLQTPPEKDPALEAKSLLTPEEIDAYGPELLEVMGKKAREAVAGELSAAQKRIKELEAQIQHLGGHVTQSTRATMFKELDTLVPGWREQNTDENFLAWLALPDTFSGVTRHELLRSAFDRNDTSRVAAFFKGFLADEAATRPAGNQPAPQEPLAPAKPTLDTFAAPGRAKTAAPAAQPAPVGSSEKPIIARADIARFYADVAAGKYRGRDKEKQEMEQELFLAQREGRIR